MKCICCDNEFLTAKFDEYYLCPFCLSYNYNSEKTAEEDNARYFNDIFSIKDVEYSKEKIKIFFRYSSIFNKKNKKHAENYARYFSEIKKSFSNKKRILEIGFGSGDNLVKLLDKGYDCYGVDLSEIAVRNFKEKYTKYKERVFNKIEDLDDNFDIVYCCALFEHIDKPNLLIEAITKKLNMSGFFIIDGLPVLNEEEGSVSENIDINFWKPCHRVIYSKKGLNYLLNKNNFIIDKYFEYETYNYRVLSLHKKYGYKYIEILRDSTIKNENLPDLKTYKRICKEALKIKSLSLYGCFWFRRIG